MAENTLQNRGYGEWQFQLYQPDTVKPLGPFGGNLEISKDFHSVVATNGISLFIVPSPNVAYVLNKAKNGDV